MFKRIKLNGTKSNYWINENGEIINKKGKTMKYYTINSGYFCVKLSKDNVKKAYLVHRLVAETFIGKIPKHMVVNHINGNKHDNRVENLEIVSYSENIFHAYNTGLQNQGIDHYKNKYDEKLIRTICEMLEDGYDRSFISRYLNVPIGLIGKIHRRDEWKSISRNYDIPDTDILRVIVNKKY
jgi:hypothetical protein